MHVDRNLKEDKELIIEHAKTDHPKYIESELSHDFFIKHIPLDSTIGESIRTIEEYDSTEDQQNLITKCNALSRYQPESTLQL